jgi:hypothetical protein
VPSPEEEGKTLRLTVSPLGHANFSLLQCDLKRPACSRCEKLRIECEGAGRQRFRFVNNGVSTNKESKTSLVLRTARPTSVPSNETSRLSGALIARLQPDTDICYSLAFSWGLFLHWVPRLIGRLDALDTSIVALLYNHTDYCLKSRVTNPSEPLVDPVTVSHYNKALREYRIALDDPKTALSIEAFLTAMVLSITQVKDSQIFNGIVPNTPSGQNRRTSFKLGIRPCCRCLANDEAPQMAHSTRLGPPITSLPSCSHGDSDEQLPESRCRPNS